MQTQTVELNSSEESFGEVKNVRNDLVRSTGVDASADYVPSSSHGYGHKTDQLYAEKIHDYSSIERRQYGERQSAYMGRDIQSDPAARYTDSISFSHQNQVLHHNKIIFIIILHANMLKCYM